MKILAIVAHPGRDSLGRFKKGNKRKPRLINGVGVSNIDIHKKIKIPIRLNEDSAEILGIFAGDGNLYKRPNFSGYRITIYAHPQERGYIDNHVIPLFKKVFNIKLKGEFVKNGCYVATIHSEGIARFLIKQGFYLGPKGNFKIPKEVKKSDRLINSFIRGLFDTDGCLLFTKRTGRKIIPCVRFKFKGDNIILDLQKYLSNHFTTYFKLNKIYHDKRGFSGKQSYVHLDHINLEKWNSLIGMKNPKNISKYINWSNNLSPGGDAV